MTELSLVEFSWFRDFRDSDLDDLRQRLRRKNYESGQLILDREDTSSDVYFVVNGRALAVFWSADGREIVYNRMPAGEAFGELSAIDGAPRSLSIYAQTECSVLVLNRDDFWDLINTRQSFRTEVLLSLTARVRQITETKRELTTHSVMDRVRSLLLRRALTDEVFTPGGVIRDAPTHAEIGNTIGANREAVSRALSSLKKSGVIATMRGEIKLLNPQALAAQEE